MPVDEEETELSCYCQAFPGGRVRHEEQGGHAVCGKTARMASPVLQQNSIRASVPEFVKVRVRTPCFLLYEKR